MIKIKQKKYFFSNLLAWATLLLPKISHAAGVIPCATSTNDRACTLCDFIVGFHNIIKYGMDIIIIVAITGITFAGVMYVISSGDEKMMEQAKGFLKASLIGFVVVFLGWLIISITMWLLSAKDSNGDHIPDLGIATTGSWNKFTCVGAPDTNSVTSTTPAVSSAPLVATTAPTIAPVSSPASSNVDLTVTPTELDFGSLPMGSSAVQKTVTLKNGNSGDVKINTVTLASSSVAGAFTVNAGGCDGTLAPAGSCTIDVSFDPKKEGVQTDTLKIDSVSQLMVSLKSVVIGAKKCELVAGDKSAEFNFILVGSKFGVPNGGMTTAKCAGAADWDFAKSVDVSEFKAMVGRMAAGVNLASSRAALAVYRVDVVYDGSNDAEITTAIQVSCPEALKGRFSNYGYVYNGAGTNAGGGIGTGKAYVMPSSKKAFYCIKNDPDNNKTFAHEQIGHAFASLEDEYVSDECQDSGFWWHNVTKNSSCTKWRSIATAPSCFQGCNCEAEQNTCYRSTDNSIMNKHWQSDGIFSPVQNYIIDGCVRDYANCPPANIVE